MKFFVILALVALASADISLRKNYGGSSFGLSGGYGSGGSYGGSYRSGGVSTGFLGGSSGLSAGYGAGLGGGYTAAGPAQLAIIQTVPGGSAGYSGGYSSGLGSYGGSSYGSGLSSGVALGGGYGGSYGGSFGGYRGGQSYSGGPIYAAVHSTRNVQVVDVGSTGEAAAPASIVIGPSIQPIDIEFQSQSSPVNIRQSHVGGQAAAPQVSSHTEEPDILKQEIVKPVIHEVTEAIQPYRTITQEVRPVLETVNQLITRGEQRQVAAVGVNRNVGVATTGLGLSGGYSGGYAGRTGYSGSSGLSVGGGYSSGASLGGGKALGLVAIQPITSVGGVVGGSGLSSGLRASYGGSSLGGGYSSGLSSLGGGYSSGSSLRSGGSYGSTLVSKPSSFSTSFGTDTYRS